MNKTLCLTLVLAALTAAAPAFAGVQANGRSYQGLSRNGVELNGLTRNGLARNGLTRNGLARNGVCATGTETACEDVVAPLVNKVRLRSGVTLRPALGPAARDSYRMRRSEPCSAGQGLDFRFWSRTGARPGLAVFWIRS